MNEAQTEFDYIDPALREAGWGTVISSRIRKQFPITQGRIIGLNRRAQPLKADYVLIYKNRLLAVIEAKAREKFYTEGVGQAKDYAKRLQIRYTYATNGLKIYEIDMENGIECDVKQFPTPDELWEMTYPQPKEENAIAVFNQEQELLSIPYEDRSGTWQPRYYQQNAISNVIRSIAEGEKRILLTLATGTGKTAIAFQIAWKLFHGKWNLRGDKTRSPRILFLADRNLLANQAFNEFNAFEDDALVRIKPDEIRKKGKIPTNGSIFFTIFQTFMSGPDDTPYFGQYPKDFFDLIVIDECHRGGANDESNWRDIMNYFSPAVQLGLTATPKRDVNVNTYRYFGNPVYKYSLKEGINDGFLTPFKVMEIHTTIDKYQYLGDDEILKGEIENEREYTESELNRIIEIKKREEYRVNLFLQRMDQSQKTLVFCASQRHALMVRDIINQNTVSQNPDYCHRVTADDGKRGEEHLSDFQNNEKSIPTILTTSHKLSTGVNTPEVRNIVLLRQINSKVEFKQIIGRGTRLFDGKDYFTIWDYEKAHEHFKDVEWDGEPIEPEAVDEDEDVEVKDPEQEYGEDNSNSLDEEYPPDTDLEEKGSKRRIMIEVQLSDNNFRSLDSMIKTTFWSPDGTPISAEAFIRQLFGDIPSFFENEDELRKIWSVPSTRKKLLKELDERGYSFAQLEDLRELIHGVDSDIFDVLSYIAYHRDMVPRLERAQNARVYFNDYNPKQQKFLNFVLEQYVRDGISELDDEKLPQLIELKYNAIADAKKELGDIKTIRDTFIGFQGYLYAEGVG